MNNINITFNDDKGRVKKKWEIYSNWIFSKEFLGYFHLWKHTKKNNLKASFYMYIPLQNKKYKKNLILCLYGILPC